MSHITLTQAEIKKVEQRVKNLFHLTDQQYGNLTYNLGMLYINYFLHDEPTAIKKLSASRIFWSWWTVQMYQYDKQLLRNTEVVSPSLIIANKYHLNTPEIRRDYYEIYHQDRYKPIPPSILFDELNTIEVESVTV